MNKCRRKKRQQPNPISTEQRDDILHANYQIESLEALHTQRTHKLVSRKMNSEHGKSEKCEKCVGSFCLSGKLAQHIIPFSCTPS